VSMATAEVNVPQRKRPTVARVERVRRMLLETHAALEELDSRRSMTIGTSLINAEVALRRWIDELRDKSRQ
jgi:hypothetical protein